MRQDLRRFRSGITCAVALAAAFHLAPARASAFDLDTGNAPAELIIPEVVPIIYGTVSPTAADATLVLRITTLVTNGWFDAIAPYHPTAIGVYSDLGRRPAAESTVRNKNISILYASLRVLNSVAPQGNAVWRGLLVSVGLDPDDTQTDLTNPIGIGNAAGMAVVAAREQDGMNQLGDAGGQVYNRLPYSDYTGYEPVNTAYELRNPSRWQPRITSTGTGLFRVQQFVTPQLRFVSPYSYDDPEMFQAPPPEKSILGDSDSDSDGDSDSDSDGDSDSDSDGDSDSDSDLADYRAQADEVLAVSAGLTDEQKMTAELFDDKLRSLGFVAFFILQSRGLTLDEFVQYDFLVNMAAFDTSIAIWKEKHRWDAVRPFSAIRFLYGDSEVTAWGGPGQATVSDLPASQWKEYLDVADHPEYPSASASFCAAHAQASRRFLGSDALGWQVPAPQGSSRTEPGVTPVSDIVLEFATWTEFAENCGLSRLWAGVHFFDSIPAGQAIGTPVGDLAYEFVRAHLEGNVN